MTEESVISNPPARLARAAFNERRNPQKPALLCSPAHAKLDSLICWRKRGSCVVNWDRWKCRTGRRCTWGLLLPLWPGWSSQ